MSIAKRTKTKTTKPPRKSSRRSPGGRAAVPPAHPASPPPGSDPIVSFADPQAWSAWLTEHHASSRGVWLRIAKKNSAMRSVDYPRALEAALCWGWIDGQRRAYDDVSFLQRFTPRRAKSIWSKINREKVAVLIASGAMRPPGLAEVERARRDGRWDAAYDPPSRVEVPSDLAAALAARPEAAAFFATLDAANRYAVLFRIHHAKKPETRTRNIARLVEMLARGETLHPRVASRAPARRTTRAE